MFDLSLHLLDISENSIIAGADVVVISIIKSSRKKTLTMRIIDNGKGISKENLGNVISPFYTSRTERSVGMGLAMLAQACEETGGRLKLKSKEGKGTAIEAVLKVDHIDCLPLGDLKKTLLMLIVGNNEIEFRIKLFADEIKIRFSSRRFKENLGVGSFFKADELKKTKGFLNQMFTKLDGAKLAAL